MKTNKRIGSVVPVENVDPHTGSYLDYGVIVGWLDKYGKPCPRKHSFCMLVEACGRRVGEWDNWAEEHAGKLLTLGDFEEAQFEGVSNGRE